MKSRGGTEPIPLPTIRSRAARSAAEGTGAVSPAIEPICTQVSGVLRSARAFRTGSIAPAGGGAPHEVEDDVDVGRHPDLLEGDRPVRAEAWQLLQACGVAAHGDDLDGAESLGDLHRHPPRTAGGAEDGDPSAYGEVDTTAQRDPGGHARVHRGGDAYGIGALGQEDAAAHVDDGALGERTRGGVVQDRVAKAPARITHHAVDTGHEREGPGGGVVRAVRLRPGQVVQPRRQDLHHHLVLPLGDGLGAFAVGGRSVVGRDDRGTHGGPPQVVCITN